MYLPIKIDLFFVLASRLPIDLNTSVSNIKEEKPFERIFGILYCGVMEIKLYSINIKFIYSPCGLLL